MSRPNGDTLLNLIRELIKNELDEANSTATAGGEYQTPLAFKGEKRKAGKKKKKAGFDGGHHDPTIGTDNFEPEDPKLRKESVVSEEKKNSNNLYLEFTDALQDFNDKCIKIADKITKLKGDKTDGKILMKNVKKHLIPLSKLMNSWNRGAQSNPHLTTEGRYHAWRNDNTLTPKQKIGMAMRETRDNLSELERVVKYNVKLKNELNVDSRSYWKNTHKALSKISERLVNLANKVGQLH
jgi:hypothetical protein